MTVVETLIRRLGESVGDAVYDSPASETDALAPRVSWVQLQGEVVAVAEQCDDADRHRLASALVNAVLTQQTSGPTNRLQPQAFALLLSALGDDLADELSRPKRGYGGVRYIQQHIWSMPGDVGAHWLGVLARSDVHVVNSLYQRGKVPWIDDDWSSRLDVFAELPPDPRPTILPVLSIQPMPRVALPALGRIALAHGADEIDPVVRFACRRIRSFTAPDTAANLDLYDWKRLALRSDLGRWMLELSGDPGSREPLVAAALGAGLIDKNAAIFLGAQLDRPAWADGEVPWSVDAVASVGPVRLPSQQLTGGDPWYTGGAEGLPWVVDVECEVLDVQVVVATHPLYGRECAALIATATTEVVDTWQVVLGRADGPGYHVEVGVAGFGSVEFYESDLVFDLVGDDLIGAARWKQVEGDAEGGLAACTVGPQHQLCQTWAGRSADGRIAQLVTDLGLLELDLEIEPVLPW